MERSPSSNNIFEIKNVVCEANLKEKKYPQFKTVDKRKERRNIMMKSIVKHEKIHL